MLETVEINYPEAKINGQALQQLEEHSESPTGESGSQKLILIGDYYVVKFIDPDDLDNEAATFEYSFEAEPEDINHFARVVYVDINREWYVQERVICTPNASITNKQSKFIQELGQKYGICDLSSYLDESDWPWPYPSHNWTVDINGTPIIFDYDY